MRRLGRRLTPVIAVAALCALLGAASRSADAAFPGPNGTIAFERSGDIWVMNPDGTAQQNLTPGTASLDLNPSFSADASRIAFVSNRDGNNEVYVMNADGSAQMRLTNDVGADEAPAWSPDGTKLAFSSNRDGDFELFTMNADGTAVAQLTANTALEGYPDWGVNGKIAFHSDRDGNAEVYVMNADGTSQTRLTVNSVLDAVAVWSPDASRIAFVSNRDGNNEVYVMNADGAAQTRITNDAAWDTVPAWSPDATRIAFMSNRLGDFEIFAMFADGSSVARLTSDAAFDGFPSWAPDPGPPQPKIAFQSNRHGPNEIYVMKSDGSLPQRLTVNLDDDQAPSWSPDGTRMAFERTPQYPTYGNGDVWTMLPTGLAQTNVALTSADEFSPDWGSGKFAFESDEAGDFDVWVMNENGTGRTRLTSTSDFEGQPDWSPNGTKIAYMRGALYPYGNAEVYTMTSTGTLQTNLTNNAAEDIDPAWSPDGTKIAFATRRDGNFEIYTMSSTGTMLTRLTTDAADDYGPAWSQDGAQLAFVSERDGNPEIYVMNANGSGQTRITFDPAEDLAPDWQPSTDCQGLAATKLGTNGNDVLQGTAGDDVLVGLGGNDTIKGLGGNDVICSGEGSDSIDGGLGADSMAGGGGIDTVTYATRTVPVSVSLDDAPNDGAAEGDNAHGDIEYVIGGSGADTLVGNAAANKLTGGNGDDSLSGGGGADTLVAGPGADFMSGGTGIDIATYSSRTSDVTVVIDDLANDGNAAVAEGDDVRTDVETVYGGSGDDSLAGSVAANTLDGGDGNDTLAGGGGNDILRGGDGDDSLAGDADNDTLDGGLDADVMAGGAGIADSALYSARTALDPVLVDLDGVADDGGGLGGEGDNVNPDVEKVFGGAGNDTLFSGASGTYYLYGNAGDDNLVGGGGLDLLYGGAGNDNLSGLVGADKLYGQGGNDSLTGNSGNDTLDGGTEFDVVLFDAAPGPIVANLLTKKATGDGTDYLVGLEGVLGSFFNDTLTGDALANSLLGLDGNDNLAGGGGDDFLSGGPGTDTGAFALPVVAGLDTGTATGEGNDTLAAIENLTGSPGNDELVGNAGPNVLTGNAGADLLQGQAGDDTLLGGAGNDTLRGGPDTDLLDGGTETDSCVEGETLISCEIGGGSVVFDYTFGLSAVDPAVGYDPTTWQIEYATCLKLLNTPDVSAPAGGQLVPDAAVSLPTVSPDGLTYTFQIRAGLAFGPPSGLPVTAPTFKESIERALRPSMGSPAQAFMGDVVGAAAFMAGTATSISGIAASGDTLTVTLTQPLTDFPARVAMPLFCATPPGSPATPSATPLATAGPYRVLSYNPGVELVLVRNSAYRGARRSNFDQITYRLNVSQATARAEVEAGTADWAAGGVPAADHSGLHASYGPSAGANQRYFVVPTSGIQYIGLNTSRPFFSDVRRRRAVAFAIDRPALAIVGGAFAGTPTDQLLGPGMLGYVDVSVYPLGGPDVPAALAALGGAGGGNVTLYAPTGANGTARATTIQSNLAAIGFAVTIQQYPFGELLSRLQTPGEPYDMHVLGWAPDYSDPSAVINALLGPANQAYSNQAYTHFTDPALTPRINAAAALTGPARTAEYADLDADLTDAAPMVPYYNINLREFFSTRIGCHTFAPLYGVDIAALCLK